MTDFEDLLSNEVVQAYLQKLVGSEGMPVAMNPAEEEITDEDLAEELDMELNIVRRTLFILYENDLASYRRLRDEETGWLTYLWTFEYDEIHDNLRDEMKKLYESLDERYEYERQHQFYICEVCGIRFEFEEAMELDFNCPECGSPLESMDNDDLLEALESRMESIDEELNLKTPRFQ
ncbi:MAG: transcription factor E [Halobacteria archaeon]|nr:transcription factor E [Halobacteria archaeon]